jgi:hypothetical protein
LYKEKQEILKTLEKYSLAIWQKEFKARANIAVPSGDNINKLCSSEAHAAMYRKIKAICGKYHSLVASPQSTCVVADAQYQTHSGPTSRSKTGK